MAADDGQLTSEELRGQLFEPFITAACVALAEMAGTEAGVRNVEHTTHHHAGGDIAVIVGLLSPAAETLVLRFPQRTAATLADRLLAGTGQVISDDLIRDCMSEIANVIAGQAKALLAGTPHQFTFTLPKVVDGASPDAQPKQGLDCWFVGFSCELGEFSLQLFLKRE
jgi:CheY-specific phosphatase CheX